MPKYTKVDNNKKRREWIEWLENQAKALNGKQETPESPLYNTDVGDVATSKDLIGQLLAELSEESVTIN